MTVKIYLFPSQEPEPKVLASNVQGKFCLHYRASARTVNPSEIASILALNSVLSTVNSAGAKVSLRGSSRLSGAHLNTLSLFHCRLHDCLMPKELCLIDNLLFITKMKLREFVFWTDIIVTVINVNSGYFSGEGGGVFFSSLYSSAFFKI